jgi:hypothetical protein
LGSQWKGLLGHARGAWGWIFEVAAFLGKSYLMGAKSKFSGGLQISFDWIISYSWVSNGPGSRNKVIDFIEFINAVLGFDSHALPPLLQLSS